MTNPWIFIAVLLGSTAGLVACPNKETAPATTDVNPVLTPAPSPVPPNPNAATPQNANTSTAKNPNAVIIPTH